MSEQAPYVQLSFPLRGRTLPADHGYGLYSALAHACPQLHQAPDWSLQTVAGMPDRRGQILLTRQSRLRLRLPGDRVPTAYALAGKRLEVGKHAIRLEIPRVSLLQPAQQLQSRLTVIKGYETPEAFLGAAERQFRQLGASGKLALARNAAGEPMRKTVKVKRFTVVGFGLEAHELDDDSALVLQRHGLGGKRNMGCGVFAPVREAA